MTEATEIMSVTDAREVAVCAHHDERDRDGTFHIAHVARVADTVARSDSHQRVAWLHDVLEDSDIRRDDLQARLPQAEFDAVLLLTHDDGEPYEDYIDRLIEAKGDAGHLARAIKEADMLDNLRRCALARDPAVSQYGQPLARLWSRDT